MEIFKNDIEANHYSLFVVSDVHEGNAGHNEKEFDLAISYIKEISKSRKVEVILNGDIIDCIEISDKRFSPVEIAEKYSLRDLKDLPRKQADYVIAKLESIKDLISYACIGNHEESYIKEHHFDVYDYYCQLLGCKKMGYFGIIRNSFYTGNGHAGLSVDIGVTHGKGGGGMTDGYALNYVHKVWDMWNVDFGVVGHIHNPIVDFAFQYKIGINLELKKKKKIYAVAPSFLETFNIGSSGYMEGRQCARATKIGILEYTIDRKNDGWSIDAKIHNFNIED